VVLFTDVDLHLAKGIALNVNGSVQRIRDQIYLPQRSPSFEAILVGEQQLPTSHQYSFSIGLSYTFGSIYNAVVNSRFAGSRGGLIQTF
jgi:hypothetical protein